jgi:putative endopeptidase
MRRTVIFLLGIGLSTVAIVAQSPKAAVETQLAKPSFTRVENRDPQKTYNKMTLAELEQLGPAFGWKAYFVELGVKQVPDLNVRQPEFFKAFAEMSSTVQVEQWRAYLRWHVINALADFLSKAFQDESFAFRGKVLNGIPEQGKKRAAQYQPAQPGDVPGEWPAERPSRIPSGLWL